MITFFIFILIISILITVHEFGHFIMAKKIGVKVEQFSLGFGPQLWKKTAGDTEYSISAIPLGGYVKLAGDNLEEYKGKSDEYFSKAPGKRFWVIFFGPLLNYLLGFLCFWFIFFAGYPTLTTNVGGLLDGFGAKEAGLIAGDKILAVDSEKVEFWEDLQKIIQKKKSAPQVKLSIERGGKELSLAVKIKEKEVENVLGKKQSVGLLGITPAEEIVKVRHGLGEAFFLGLAKTWNLTATSYIALAKMITAKISIREATGPLGIFLITSKVARLGIIAILNFIGVISVSLAVFNLLPFPVLDGGHILLLGLEKLRRKALSIKAERIITQVGFTFLITLTLVVTYNDILRFFSKH